MSDGRFAGQTILVCGAATGIGAATARLLAREGAGVIVQYRTREAEALQVCADVLAAGGRARVAQGDLTDAATAAALFAGAEPIDAFVHAISAPLGAEPFAAAGWPAFAAQLEASVKTAFLLLQAALACEPCARAGVFVSSIVTSGAPPKDWSAYVTAKSALAGLVRSVAQEAAGRGLRLNLVSPGLTETPLTAGIDPRRRELAGRATPLKRLGTVDEAAAAIAFLLSNESAYIAGADLPVAGATVL